MKYPTFFGNCSISCMKSKFSSVCGHLVYSSLKTGNNGVPSGCYLFIFLLYALF